MITKRNLIRGTLIVLLFAGILSCKSKKNEETENNAAENLPENIVELRVDQQKLAGIELGTIEKKELSGTLKVSGNVNVPPEALAMVSKPIGGSVKSIVVRTGDYVKKGQILANLQNQEFVDLQQNYLETKSRFELASAQYNRHAELYKEEVYSEKSMQEITAEYKTSKTQLKSLEQKLLLIGINPKHLTDDNISSSVAVVSPISGYVKSVNINIGKFVSASDILFEIVSTDKLILELTLFEKDIDKASNGQRIRFLINNEQEQHDALVSQISKSVNEDKTYKVYANILHPCKNIIPGMYVNALIETSGKQVQAVPSEAVVSFEDKDYIFIFEKNKKEDGKNFTEYKMIQVQKGISDMGYTEISLPDGVKAPTVKIVVKGAYNLLSAKKNAGEMAC
jgi:cobalt-zinc-cadmium efflux system membrane fusion protein